jgi:hypothetical protein
MRPGAILVFMALAAATPEIGYFRYERPLENLPQLPGQTCVALDPAIFAHASAQLADLRVYRNEAGRDGAETAYAIHTAATIEGKEQPVALMNLGRRGGETVFDAAMPEGSYNDIQLAITGHDFIAAVTVSGSQSETRGAETRLDTKLGSYTIFDLTKQKLGRSTVLHLADSDFRYLHFRVAGPIAPDDISGLSAGRLLVGQPKYVTVAESTNAKQLGHESVIEFTVPEHVPVDRILFAPVAAPANFSRDVTVSVTAAPQTPSGDGGTQEPTAGSSGNLLRVHSVQEGRRIEEERLTLDAPRAAEFDTEAKWKVSIDNGDDPPIAFQSVRLEMLERSLCFDAAAGAAYTLYYGDPTLAAPRYDYARLFAYDANAPRATTGAEELNAAYHPRPDQRPFTERHPALLWVALVAVIAVLGVIALRTAKRTQQVS